MADFSRQQQTGGDNSQQYAAQRDIVQVVNNNFGMTEERMREILAANRRELAAEFAAEAEQLVAVRSADFEERLTTRLAESGVLGKMTDPSFLLTVKRAQMSAAAAETDPERDLIAAMLEGRAKDDTRAVRAAVDRAVQVVDLLDDYVLQLLTHFYMFNGVRPATGWIGPGLAAMNSWFETLGAVECPTSDGWIAHAAQLDLVRPSSGVTTRKPAIEILAQSLPGYFTDGILARDYFAATAELSPISVSLPNLLVDHELFPGEGRRRFLTSTIDGFDPSNLGTASDEIARERLAVISAIQRPPLSANVGNPANVTRAREQYSELTALWSMIDLWDAGAESYFTLTPAGIALAYANATRKVELNFPLQQLLTFR